MPLVRVLVLMPCKGNKTILDKLYGLDGMKTQDSLA